MSQPTIVRPEQETLIAAFDTFLDTHGVDVEDFCAALAACWSRQADNADDATVQHCLYSAAEHLTDAGMDWYVSTK